jgi:CRP-like cAMP-binding protein
MTSAIPTSRNRLLTTLPPASLARLWPLLTPVELELHEILQRPEQPVGTVYFPETGWLSMLAMLEDGDSAEVGLIGREGVIGLPVILGDDCDDLEAMVQCPGSALSLQADALRAAMADDPDLRTLLLRYALVHHGQVARTAACNGRHQIDQRLARWLLTAHDRAEGDDYPMTHEFLAMMLGVRRAGITVAAGALQKAGLIRYRSGRMIITDRPGLEASACECYGIVRRASDRLFGPAAETRGEYRR